MSLFFSILQRVSAQPSAKLPKQRDRDTYVVCFIDAVTGCVKVKPFPVSLVANKLLNVYFVQLKILASGVKQNFLQASLRPCNHCHNLSVVGKTMDVWHVLLI